MDNEGLIVTVPSFACDTSIPTGRGYSPPQLFPINEDLIERELCQPGQIQSQQNLSGANCQGNTSTVSLSLDLSFYHIIIIHGNNFAKY